MFVVMIEICSNYLFVIFMKLPEFSQFSILSKNMAILGNYCKDIKHYNHSRRWIIRTPDNTNSRYIEQKSVPLDLIYPHKTLDVTNSRYNELFIEPLKVCIIERLLYLQVTFHSVGGFSISQIIIFRIQ